MCFLQANMTKDKCFLLANVTQNKCFLQANMTKDKCFLQANYVLDHSWETMCCISPWKLCVVSFGPQLLGPQPWFPALGRQGPWPIGPGCVASRLAYYVLHQCLEIMCFASPLGDDGVV